MHEVWTWNESHIGNLINDDLEDRRATFDAAFMLPSTATLAKLARWGKAAALYETRRLPTFAAARLVVALEMSRLYVAMDAFRRGFSTLPVAIPNDETLAKMSSAAGDLVKAGMSEQQAGQEVFRRFLVNAGEFLVADGGKPFEMADLDSLNHP